MEILFLKVQCAVEIQMLYLALLPYHDAWNGEAVNKLFKYCIQGKRKDKEALVIVSCFLFLIITHILSILYFLKHLGMRHDKWKMKIEKLS